jgi:galactokinase
MVDQGLQPRGVDCVFGGDIPRGSGMSSSAALSCGFAFGVNELFGLGLDRVALAWLGRDAEHRFAGVKCGIMDQFASLLGKHGKLIRLDCRTLDFAYVPFERSDLRVLLCDSQVRRELAGSEYNLRRGQCERGVTILSGHYPGVASLRDATSEMLAAHRSEFDPVVYRRCAYVIEENQRVGKACEALAASDFAEFGALMNESHRGLSTEYEVSSVELDVLAEAARLIPGVQGSRMMGAGFGGCTINLVEEAAAPEFHQRMAVVFRAKLGKEPMIHECRIAGGTHVPSAEHSAYSTVRTAV